MVNNESVRESHATTFSCRTLRAASLAVATATGSGCALRSPYDHDGRLYPGQLHVEHPNYIDGLNGPATGGLTRDRSDAWLDVR